MRRIFYLALAFSLSVGLSLAASISFSGSLPTTPTNFADLDVTVPVAFDPSLGTLTSITISVLGNTTGNATITNGSGGAATYTGTLFTSIQVADAAHNVLASASPSFPFSIIVPAGSSATTPTETGTATGLSFVPSSDWDLYTITGDIHFLVSATGNAETTGTTPFDISTSTSADATITITYNFAEIPEPATMALLGAGFVGLAIFSKGLRRKAKKLNN